VIVVVLAVLAVWRLEDLAARGNFGLIFRLAPESVMFWGEFGLGIALPLVLFALPWVRRTDSGLILAATLTIMGFIVNRLNVAITGMTASSGVVYVPSWMELAVTISIVAAGFALFALAVRYLNVFPDEATKPVESRESSRRAPVVGPPIFTRRVLVTLWGLLLVGAVAVAYSTGQDADRAAADEERPRSAAPAAKALPSSSTLPAPYGFPTSADSPGPVTFDHESHVDFRSPSCATCHRTLFRLNVPGTPVEGELTYERIHEGDLCASCHDGRESFAVDDDCTLCHR